MSTPSVSGSPMAIETADHAAFDLSQRQNQLEVDTPIHPGQLPAGKRSKARVKCTWKGCTYQEPDVNEMK